MKDILTELVKGLRKDISSRKPKDKVANNAFLFFWASPLLQLLRNTTLPLSSALVWTINYEATPGKGRDTES